MYRTTLCYNIPLLSSIPEFGTGTPLLTFYPRWCTLQSNATGKETKRRMLGEISLQQSHLQPAKEMAKQYSWSKTPSAPVRAGQSKMLQEGVGGNEGRYYDMEVLFLKRLYLCDLLFLKVSTLAPLNFTHPFNLLTWPQGKAKRSMLKEVSMQQSHLQPAKEMAKLDRLSKTPSAHIHYGAGQKWEEWGGFEGYDDNIKVSWLHFSQKITGSHKRREGYLKPAKKIAKLDRLSQFPSAPVHHGAGQKWEEGALKGMTIISRFPGSTSATSSARPHQQLGVQTAVGC